jgi:hypothetical protein
MRTRPFIIAALLAVLAVPAFAQAPAGGPPQGAPTNIRGKIVKLDGSTLTVKTNEGPTVAIALAADTNVRSMTKKKLSDIKSGDYVASISVPGNDGKLHAIEVHDIPARAPEIQTPYDLKPGSLMTNAPVNGIVKGQHGTTLTMTYKGNTADIIVDSKTKIFLPVTAAMTDLKPGKAVYLRATKTADGSLSANSATVEKNGVKPVL